MNTDPDRNVSLLARLAHDAGATLPLVEALHQGGPAGTPSLVTSPVDELEAAPAAAVERLLDEAARCESTQHGGLADDAEVQRAVARVEAAARMTGWLLPGVGRYGDVASLHPRYLLGDGRPSPGAMSSAAVRLQGYLDEHDRGCWVHPIEVAAAVADVVDAAVLYRLALAASAALRPVSRRQAGRSAAPR